MSYNRLTFQVVRSGSLQHTRAACSILAEAFPTSGFPDAPTKLPAAPDGYLRELREAALEYERVRGPFLALQKGNVDFQTHEPAYWKLVTRLLELTQRLGGLDRSWKPDVDSRHVDDLLELLLGHADVENIACMPGNAAAICEGSFGKDVR